ncbi:ABC transporter ATP-binding protein [Candidatus Bipolaricaulota bacterium]|nr:ABC transporter ATP-binding protein [Candidatus Bipolaricaulota bacterium]
MELLQLDHVEMVFERGWIRKRKGAWAISGVSMVIREGEILALVGESGCGKTTLGKIALGLLRPTSGRVLYKGRDIWSADGRGLRPTGQMVHQDSYSALNPVRTVYQTLAAPLRRYGVPRNKLKEEAEKLLEFVGIMPPKYFLNKYPYHLSGGMRQRLVFARSIIPKPSFIVTDEPVSMIDASLRLSILDLMLKLNREFKIAFLYITHDLATARYLAQEGRIVVLYLGKIVEEGRMKDVLERPLHPYLRALLSAAPVPDPKIARKRKPIRLKEAEPPSAEVPPPGCRFHPRCPYAEEVCSREEPPLRDFREGHRGACHLIEVLPPWRLM